MRRRPVPEEEKFDISAVRSRRCQGVSEVSKPSPQSCLVPSTGERDFGAHSHQPLSHELARSCTARSLRGARCYGLADSTSHDLRRSDYRIRGGRRGGETDRSTSFFSSCLRSWTAVW